MSDQLSVGCSSIDNSETTLHRILKSCTNFQSSESLLIEDFNDVIANNNCDYFKMLSSHSTYSTHSSNISTSSYASDESFGENILEENGRISLAYENLRTIPKRIAEKFAAHTKVLDLSYNNFHNLSFLSFFETLHTLILDRNARLDVNTLPYLPNLRILWINNCEISNVTEWVQRIQTQCPVLEHLSIMGNPGITSNFSFCTLISDTPHNPVTPTSRVSDYREYILHVLPNLEFLDGVAQRPTDPCTLQPAMNEQHNQSSFKKPNTAGSTALNGAINISSSTATPNRLSDNRFYNTSSIKYSPSLSFKEIFRLKRRKKSYQSSSTN